MLSPIGVCVYMCTLHAHRRGGYFHKIITHIKVNSMSNADGGKVINLAERKQQRVATEEQDSDSSELPDFISPPTIASMSDEQLEKMLNLVRMRRLQSALIYERTQEENSQKLRDRASEALAKKSVQVFNELDRVFKNLDKLETRVIEMRALRIAAGLSF